MEDLFEQARREVGHDVRQRRDLDELSLRADIACGVIPDDPARLDPDDFEQILPDPADLPPAFEPGDLTERPVDDVFAALEAEFHRAEAALFDANRAMATHLEAVRRALETARRQPELFLPERARLDRDAPELAQRAAAAELSMRLKVPAGTLRNRAHEATVLRERLPLVWQLFADGIAAEPDARAAAEAAVAFDPGDPRLDELDGELAAIVGTLTASRFRQRVREVRARLDRASLEARHSRAYSERRVAVDRVDDGMSWVSLLISSIDAAKIDARLDAAARAGHGGDERGSPEPARRPRSAPRSS